MRRIWLAGLLVWLAQGASAEVRTVYLMPMGSGLDQYLANQLTAAGAYEVVTDPKRADAVFTDHLGESFEQKLAELLAPPKEEDEKGDDKVVHLSTFSRGKNTIFLVDVKNKSVLWSAYEKPKNSSPDELNRTATRIVQRLKKK
jgi:hypothetical protein